MHTAAVIVSGLVALLHLGFMVLETFLFTTPTGRKIFGLRREAAETQRVLAANQGIYNGALALCLLWSLWAGNGSATMALLVFVVVVGLYGAATVSRTIFVLQALPALVALLLFWLA